MKKIMFVFSLVIASVSCNGQKKEFSKETLDYELTAIDSSKVSFESIIEKHKGKTILIEVWAGWCSDCTKAMPLVKEMQVANPTVDFVFISVDKFYDKWKTAINRNDIKGDHYWVNDPEMMKGAFGKSIDLDWIPRYIIIHKTGKIQLYKATEKDFGRISKELTR